MTLTEGSEDDFDMHPKRRIKRHIGAAPDPHYNATTSVQPNDVQLLLTTLREVTLFSITRLAALQLTCREATNTNQQTISMTCGGHLCNEHGIEASNRSGLTPFDTLGSPLSRTFGTLMELGLWEANKCTSGMAFRLGPVLPPGCTDLITPATTTMKWTVWCTVNIITRRLVTRVMGNVR
eukprot:5047274-Amphidinium_carterae.1